MMRLVAVEKLWSKVHDDMKHTRRCTHQLCQCEHDWLV